MLTETVNLSTSATAAMVPRGGATPTSKEEYVDCFRYFDSGNLPPTVHGRNRGRSLLPVELRMPHNAKKSITAPFYLTTFSILLTILAVPFLPFSSVVSYGIGCILSSAFYLICAWTLQRIDLTDRALFVFIISSLFVRLSFLAIAPIGSDDLYRYIWDGKVQAHGINPYSYSATDERLRYLHSPLLPSAINHPDLKTIYFPLSQWIFFLCFKLSGEAVWGFKLALLLAESATIAGLILVLKKLNISHKFVLLYALCPLPIMQFGVDGHLDALGLPLLIFSVYFLADGRKLLSFLLLGLSISVKPAGLVLLPAYFVNEKEWPGRLNAIWIPLATVGVQFLPYLGSPNPFEMLGVFAKNWTFNGIFFEAVNLLLRDNQTSRLICGIVLLLVVLMLSSKKGEFFDVLYFSVLALLLCSPVVHPWYVSWLAVLLPLRQQWSGIVFSATVGLTSYTVINYRLHGLWEQSALVLLLEYLPVLYFTVKELTTAGRR